MKQYLDDLRFIMENGIPGEDRTGVGTLSVFGMQTRYDLEKGFPLLTTKELKFDSIASELLWFLEGSTDERRLAEIYYRKPRGELTDKKTIWTANADHQGKLLGYENNDLVKELGPIYGNNWRAWKGANGQTIDQIKQVIETIKTNPNDRRIIVSAWNVSEIEKMALPPCHVFFQFYVRNGKLSCQMYQRSMDAFLGAGYNIASYSLLTMMIAQVCDLLPGEFIHTVGDAHIYKNHLDQVQRQLAREPFQLPILVLDPFIDDIDNFTMDSFTLIDYQHYPPIKAPMAV